MAGGRVGGGPRPLTADFRDRGRGFNVLSAGGGRPHRHVTFASPSAVESFASSGGDLVRGLPVAVIGPVTEQTARGLGLDVRIVASPSTGDGLVDALEQHFSEGG